MAANKPSIIERKWQQIWKKTKLYQAKDFSKKPKYYILDMFPYPSGEGLHVGHPKGYIATDVICRYLKMKGYNVLHPMGWDAFGLPAENYAIKTKTPPSLVVEKNIKKFKGQLGMLGLDYDWAREINTTDPEYYKWTQWIFSKMFEHGLAYSADAPINWCPSCKTGLANEEVEGGKCFRCETQVVRKKIKQWVLKITAYAERLLEDLEGLDWPEPIKLMQRNWIGRSEGTVVEFPISNFESPISVFTTRIDTIFGVVALVVAPEHKIVRELKSKILNWPEIEKYLTEAEKKSELERTELQKEKTGVELKGIKAVNTINGEEIPIWIGDYVIGSYGGGAVMVVPAHDQRDYDFAIKYNLPIKEVIKSLNQGPERDEKGKILEAYEGEGVLINSGNFSDLTSGKGREELTKWLNSKGLGGKKVNYKFRDWIFSRQRYWGEPIPLVFCEKCKEKIEKKDYKKGEFNQGEMLNPGWIALRERDLPLVLPRVKAYQPTGTGESPLANIKNWVETKCPKCGARSRRETNTMPQWAGSCWYYLRYVDSKNKKELINSKKERYWLPVDCYVGGAEHAVLHLLYARFWHKFLYDIDVVTSKEPFMKLKNQGMILGENGEKMSKSRGNVVSPDDIVKKYGADVLRVYEMFMGPFEGAIPWSTQSIEGVNRFLNRVKKIITEGRKKIDPKNNNPEITRHQTIKKVTQDILNFKFNTAISCLMEYLNKLEEEKSFNLKDLEVLILLLCPFAPHLTEELWHNLHPRLSKNKSIFGEIWPEYQEELTISGEIEIIIQISGKLRDKISVFRGASKEEVEERAFKSQKVQKHLENKQVKKTIFVQDRLINFVI